MLSLTEGTINKFKEIIADEGEGEAGVRLAISTGGCCPSLVMEIAETADEGDQVMEQGGLKVYLDQESSEWLKNATIAFTEEEGFVVSGVPQSSC